MYFKLILPLLFLGFFSSVSSQFLAASDTSPESVRKYKNIITANQEVVKFIEYTLVKKGLPKHLRNLALIESHFDRNVTSGAGAVGVWQFMTAHANQYGLTDNRRNDLYRSTQVAAISLSKLYKKYNNWVTVVAAYNCGEGNIAKAMQAANSTQYHVFAKFLPAETIGHVKKYLDACFATGELTSVLENYNNSHMNAVFIEGNGSNVPRIMLSETEINAGFNLKIIAEELNMEYQKILDVNPGIENELQSKGEAVLFLPTDKMPDFLLRKTKILSRSIKEKR